MQVKNAGEKPSGISYQQSAINFLVSVEKGLDGYLISEVIELPGCHSQAKTNDELIKRTKEAISLYLEARKDFEPKTEFVSLQQLEV